MCVCVGGVTKATIVIQNGGKMKALNLLSGIFTWRLDNLFEMTPNGPLLKVEDQNYSSNISKTLILAYY